MLESIIWVLLAGFFAGRLAQKLRIPALVGMVLVGILLGPQVGNILGPEILASAKALRTIAVMVILMKAGLGLDREKLAQQGSVALRLGFLPAACEALMIAVVAMWLLNFDFVTGLLLGCIIGAESPAVIVPGMLRLKSLGWGVTKGIPDAILTGSALSDVLLLLLFSLLLTFLTQGNSTGLSLLGNLTLTPLQLLPFQVVIQIVLGVFLGWLSAKVLAFLRVNRNWMKNVLKKTAVQNTADQNTVVQDTLVAASFALGLVVLAEQVPVFSGYLAVMAMGFFVIEQNAPLARRLRNGFNGLWTVAEIVLFVLLGASIQLQVLENTLWIGLLMLAIGTLVGRSLGWYLSTLGSNWTWPEKLFLLPGNSAKATVQAAIGAIPLAQGIEGGEAILALSALSILVTAPLGAWAIPTFAPKLLTRGEVDPTKVAIARKTILLAAIDTSPSVSQVLIKAAELARQYEGTVIALHIVESTGEPIGEQPPQPAYEQLKIEALRSQAKLLLADVCHQFVTKQVVTKHGAAAQEIIQCAQAYGATEIIIGKQNCRLEGKEAVGLVARSVLSASSLPVIVVSQPLTTGNNP
jgi:solute carrier family 9B (sodium/hydrogen exchanger), member 1/2